MGSWIATINCLDETNSPSTLYFSDDGYKSTDGVYYQNRLVQPAKVSFSINDGGLLNVIQQSSIGEIELTNVDGQLDYLADYALDGRDCVIQYVDKGKITTWIKGIVTRINQRNTSIYLTVKTMSEALDLPIQLARYQGTGEAEGLTTTIMGQVKPRVYGEVINATPVLCDSTNYVYQISDSPTTEILNVYDKAGRLGEGATKASLFDLQNSTPEGGKYDRFQGYFKLYLYSGVQQVTCSARDTSKLNAGDVFKAIVDSVKFAGGKRIIAEAPTEIDQVKHIYQASTSVDFVINAVYNDGTQLKFGVERASNDLATIAPAVGTYDTFQGYFRINPPLESDKSATTGNYEPIILGNITYDATNNGVTPSSDYSITMNPDSVALMNSFGKVGLFVNEDTTVRELLDRLVKSIGGFWWIGNYDPSNGYSSNTINVALYEIPDSTNTNLEVNNWQIISAERTATGIGQNGIPFYSVKADYDKVETPQKDVLVTTENYWRARVLKGTKVVESVDSAIPDIKTLHPQSTRLSFESLLKDSDLMKSVTDRLLKQFKTRCDVTTITANYNELPALTLNSTIRLNYNRLGYSQGYYFRLLGCDLDVKRKSVTMQLIGQSQPIPTHGWAMGGRSDYNPAIKLDVVEGFTFSNYASVISSVTLSLARTNIAGVNSFVKGYCMAGSPWNYNQRLDGFVFSNHTAFNFGNVLEYESEGIGSFNSKIKGYSAGNYVEPLYIRDKLNSFIFSSETQSHVASVLTTDRYDTTGCDSEIHGYVLGSWDRVSIDSVQFSTESVNTISYSLPMAIGGFGAGCNSSTSGYLMGGYDMDYWSLSTISGFRFSDNSSISHGASLSLARGGTGTDSKHHGFVMGGYSDTDQTDVIDGFEFSNHTSIIASVTLSESKYAVAGCTGY